MKRYSKIFLAVLSLIALSLSLFAVFASASGEIVTEGEMADIKNDFASYLVQDTRKINNDGYVGALQYTVYYDSNVGGTVKSGIGGTPIIVYAINTNTERVGTDSNKSIITSMLERGYVVVVLDYLGNEAATGHKLDDSAQNFVQKLKPGSYFTRGEGYVFGASGSYAEVFVVPSGHDVLLNQTFWEIDKHSADGTLDKIVENWNTDFKGTKAERLVKWATGTDVSTRKKVDTATDGTSPVWYNANGAVDANGLYTKVKYTVAESITDCVKPDGSPLDMDMKLHLVYPTNPQKEVPVLSVSCCWGYPTNTHMCYTDLCSHHTGALFRGYAGAIYDYLWQPMARDSAFGYYDGNLNTTGAVTGDHMNYSIHLYNDKLINTAAIRYLRYLALSESGTYKFDLDAFCTIGLSKGGWFTFLGEEVLQSGLVDPKDYATTEALETAIDEALAAFTKNRIFYGHHGETRYQAGNTETITGGTYVGEYAILGGEKQPWLTYNGVEIISGVQLTYAANGSQEEDISAGHAPMFSAAHMNDEYNAAYGSANTTYNLARSLDIPLVFFEVDQLHEFAYYPDMYYSVETYDAFFDFANYYLKNGAVKVFYTAPYNNDGDISLTDKITIQFSGAVTESEIVKVTVSAGGEAIEGTWMSVFGGTQWVFTPNNMQGGTEYTITVPSDLAGNNGVPMGYTYTSTFITEAAEEVEASASVTDDGVDYTLTLPETVPSGMDSFLFSFAVANNAANVAELYEKASGNLLGSVNLRGIGTYEINITDYVNENLGNTVTFTLKAAKAAGESALMEKDFSTVAGITTYSGAPSSIVMLDKNGNEVASNGDSALKIYIESNKGTYGGGDAFYGNVSSAMAIGQLLGSSKITKDDLGRQIEIILTFYDTVSRTLKLSLNSMTNAAAGVMDYDLPMYNITTKAGEWMTVTVPYVVYDTDYGVRSSATKTIYAAISPTGNTNMPIYFSEFTVKETVTEMNVIDGSLVAKNLGGAGYKAPESDYPIAVYNGNTLVGSYTTWKAALSAYVNGYTVKLLSDYTLVNADVYSDIGTKFENVIIDLNGYTVYSENTANSLIWAKNSSKNISKTSITLKNGGIVLADRPLISYESSTFTGASKTFDVTLDNLKITLAEGAMLTSLISDKASTAGSNINLNVHMNECDIDLGDEDKRASVMLTLMPRGESGLQTYYKVTGGSISISHPRWITVIEDSTYSEFKAGESGNMSIYIPAAYKAPSKVSYLTDDGYADLSAKATVANVTEYTLSAGEGSTRYGVIPEEYRDAASYPFVLFRDGSFIGAYSDWKNALTAAQNSVNNSSYLESEAALLLRADYRNVGSAGPQINAATNIVFDLGGYSFITEDVGLDLSANYAAAPYATNITVKNGTLLAARIAFLDNQIFAAASGEKVYNITFEGVTFAFYQEIGDFWGDMLHTPWTNVASSIATVTNVNYNDCTFDLRNYPLTSAYRIFNVKDNNLVLNVNIAINGGELLMDSPQYVTFANMDANDSLIMGKGSDGNYMTLTVYGNYSAITNNFVTDDGESRTFKSVGSSGDETYYELQINSLVTKYGIIPNEYADSAAYPYATFIGGNFEGVYTNFKDAMNAGISLANGSSSEAVILLRADNSVSVASYLSDLNGKLRFDLGKNTLTSQKYLWDQYVNAGQISKSGTFTVCNGSMVRGNNGIPMIGMNQGTTNSGTKKFNIVFEGVTFSTVSGGGVGILMDSWDNNALTLDISMKLVDCTVDFTDASTSCALIGAGTSKNYTKANITFVGGSIIASDISKYNLTALGSEDSVTYLPDEDGKYITLTTPSTAANSTKTYPTDKGDMYFVEIADDTAVSTRTLASITTNYGAPTASQLSANPKYLSAVDYPFFIFSDGIFSTAETSWLRAVNAAKTLVNSSANHSAEIVMRRDYDVVSGVDNGANFINVDGIIVLDLANHTLNAASIYTIDIYFNYNSNTSYLGYESSILFKNGTLKNSRTDFPAIAIGHTGTVASGYTKKVLNFNFENVTFSTSAVALFTDWGHDGVTGLDINISAKDCMFDFTGASNNVAMFKLNTSKTNVNTDVNLRGINIIASDISKNSLVTLGSDDTFTVEKGSDGNYGTLTQSSSATYPSLIFNTGDGKTVSFMEGKLDGSAMVYEITEDIATEYGYIPARYASAEDYPFVVFCNGKFVLATKLFGKDASASALHSSKSEGSVILLRCDFEYTEGQYNNLSQTYSMTFDLDGHTFTSTDRHVFWAQKKTPHDTKITVKNGTFILGSKALMGFSSWDPASGGWTPAYTGGNSYYFNFENVNIELANGSTLIDVICTNQFPSNAPDMTVNLNFVDCDIDLSGSASASVNLFDMTNSLYTVKATLTGGNIISNGLVFAENANANVNSAVKFVKGDNGYTTLTLPKGVSAPTDSFDSYVFGAASETETHVIYKLIPESVAELGYAPKVSITLDQNLIMNIYIPVNGTVKFTLDGGIYENLESFDGEIAEIDGAKYYKMSIELSSSEAAREVVLLTEVTSDDSSAIGTFTFSIPKYAEKVVSSENEIEVTLVKDVLSYIRAAYVYFGTDDAEALAKIDDILGEDYDSSSVPEFNGSAEAPVVGLRAATYDLGATPAIRFYITGNADSYEFYVDGNKLKTVTGSDEFGAYIEMDVYAYAMGKTVTYKIDGTESGSYHINSYYTFVKSNEEYKDNTALIILVERFAKYCESAEDYRISVIG